MDDDVISEFWREERNAIVETQVPFSGTRTPTGGLIANGNTVMVENDLVSGFVERGEVGEAGED